MASSILQLCDIITSSASTLVATCAENDLALPQLDDELSLLSGAFRAHPVASDAANIISAAALQLVATLLPPQQSVLGIAAGGLHLNEIAAKADINTRLLRVLANHHIYKEISPDVFTNTLLSRALDTGKSNAEIQANPNKKHDGTSGFPALMEHCTADALDSSAHLLENLKDSVTANSEEPNCAPFNRALKVDVPLWAWYDQPEQSYRRERFSFAMHGAGMMQPPDILLNGYDWGSLPKGALMVDVGGGTGASSLLVARAYPHIDIVIQDSPPVVEAGKALWSSEYPEALESGRVKFQAHDFFTPQPLKNASVFLLKQILHDWSDAYASTLLTELRKAASEDTKLVAIDNIISYTCHDSSLDGEDAAIAGAADRDAPAPLLANFGAANDTGYIIDMVMMMYLNSQNRTFKHLRELLQKNGWSVVKARRADPPNNFFEPIIALPI